MRILLLDIETSPNIAHVWGIWQQNIGINQLIESSSVLCWAAKWYGEDEIMFDSVFDSRERTMLKRVHKLLDQADAVLHYNGTKFDIPTLNKEFLKYGLNPPAPFKQIDLLRTARSAFRFPSNKLDYVARQLKLGAKTQHKGHELWIGCMENDSASWEIMREYNINDVVLLEKVYNKLKPWVKGHANLSVHSGEEVCPKCGSNHYQKRGLAVTHAGKYQRFQCRDCGAWFRDNKNLARGLKKFVEVNN